MKKMQINDQLHPVSKGYIGYVEHLAQYTGEGANVVVNIHKNSRMNFHMHDFYEINYVTAGECNNLFEDGPLAMKQGDFVIVHPSAMHSLFVDNGSEVYNFLVSREFIYGLFSRIKECENAEFSRFFRASRKEGFKYLYVSNKKTTAAIAKNLISAKKSSVRPLLYEALMQELLLAVSQMKRGVYLSKSTVQGTAVLQNILIRMQYDYKTITLDDMAKEYGYSKAHICKLFRLHYDTTFSQKLNQIRILHAQKLLSDTHMPVTEIAYALGFDSPEYFHRLFKKICLESPGSYRLKAQE